MLSLFTSLEAHRTPFMNVPPTLSRPQTYNELKKNSSKQQQSKKETGKVDR